jgi:hypothetical protein
VSPPLQPFFKSSDIRLLRSTRPDDSTVVVEKDTNVTGCPPAPLDCDHRTNLVRALAALFERALGQCPFREEVRKVKDQASDDYKQETYGVRSQSSPFPAQEGSRWSAYGIYRTHVFRPGTSISI